MWYYWWRIRCFRYGHRQQDSISLGQRRLQLAKTRRLIRVDLPPKTEEGQEDTEKTKALVYDLMGKKPEFRFKFITEHAQFVKDLFV